MYFIKKTMKKKKLPLRKIERKYCPTGDDTYLFLIILQDFYRLTIMNNEKKEKKINRPTKLIKEYYNFKKKAKK